MQLSGKVAAVTRAASGIGLECARAMLAAGARVAALVDRAADRLQEVCAELGDRAIPITNDLLDRFSVAQVMPQILENAGHLGVVTTGVGAGSAAVDDALQFDRSAGVDHSY
jgi:ribitol 2-dehydrogenase